MRNGSLSRIAFVADYLPRKCGIATFTADLRAALATEFPETDFPVTAVTDSEEGYPYPAEVRFEWPERDLDSYRRAADFINFSNADCVSLQHEFGIFGGTAGGHVLSLLHDVAAPVVTTLHTVLNEPGPDHKRVMEGIIEESARLVVMSQRGVDFLRDVYAVPERKIDLIPHGIPDMPFVDPNFYKDHFGVEGREVALTFGLLSPNKGIENVINALPEVVAAYPDFVYIVLGATHPNVVRNEGEAYRRSLERTARDLGLERNVVFYNRFVDQEELKEFLGAADLYVTPYLNEAQITSGTLAYSFGCGKAVISTPYWHAAELLADNRGVLVPFSDPQAISAAILDLLQNETKRHAMRKQAYLMGREMLWSTVAHQYLESFTKSRRHRLHAAPRILERWTLEERPLELPPVRLDYLRRITDSTGVLQHARHAVARYDEGYTTDDNARALLLTVWLENAGYGDEELRRMASSYAAFLQYAFDPTKRRFLNFMGYDRRWLPEKEYHDNHGRAVRALGACVGYSRWRGLRSWAVELFDQALHGIRNDPSPRAWAAAIVGMDDYLSRLGGARVVENVFAELTGRLMKLYREASSEDWPWFEDIATYENAILPHALILSAHRQGDDEVLEAGLEALGWLLEVQTAEQGHFQPIGTNGFYPRGETPARFDQQPLEAQTTASACIAAHQATGDERWRTEAQRAFEWFLGRNDLGVEVFDANTGGCCDGLHEDRLNLNMGAESTIAYLLAHVEMTLRH